MITNGLRGPVYGWTTNTLDGVSRFMTSLIESEAVRSLLRPGVKGQAVRKL